MLSFIVDNKEFETALSISSLATGPTQNAIESHCLFEFSGGSATIYSTDKDKRVGKVLLPLKSCEGEGNFTVDPKKLLDLLRTTSNEMTKLIYFPDTTTLEVYASEDQESFVSLPSFDTALYPDIRENFKVAVDVKELDARILITGIRFIQGFLLKNAKSSSSKYSNLFISNGIFYGTNGNNKIGAFTCKELTGVDGLAFPEIMLSSINALIDKVEATIFLQTTSKYTLISSSDRKYTFGFLKPLINLPKIPIDIKKPEAQGGATLDTGLLLKKLERLKIAGDTEMGIRLALNDEKLNIATLLDRASKDSMACSRIDTKEDKEIMVRCRILEGILKSFISVNRDIAVQMFIDQNVRIFWNGEVELIGKDKQVNKTEIFCVGKLSSVTE